MKNHILLALWAAATLLICSVAYSREDTEGGTPNSLHRPTKLMETVGKSVVKLSSSYGHGTGFAVKWGFATLTLTNRHVCDIAENKYLDATRHDGSVHKVKVLHVSASTDICFTEHVQGAPGLSLEPEWYGGEDVRVLGHPGGGPLRETMGIMLGFQMVIQEYAPRMGGSVVLNFPSQVTSVPVWPGSSGSPVINAAGYVVGVVWAVNPALGLSFAVPTDSVIEELVIFVGSF